MANQPPPASNSLVAGAQCSFVSPFDEYMCPGPSGQHNYYLRCLSGSFVQFACSPGTVCMKTEGQNMYCGIQDQNHPDVPADSSAPPFTMPEGASDDPFTSPEVEISGISSELSSSIDSDTPTSDNLTVTDVGTPTEVSDSIESLESTDSEEPTQILSDDMSPLPSATSNDEDKSVSTEISVDLSVSSTGDIFDDTWPSSTIGAETSVDMSTDMSISTDSGSEAELPQPTITKPGSGLTGPMISSGLQMVLQNGVKLPFTLPDIDLPEIDLATVHLPDMTFDGIALTALQLPSITIPPMDPASLTNFDYIVDLMNKAGISFDDLAKMPLPDLSHLDLKELSHIDVANAMSIANVNRISLPDEVSAQELAEPLPPVTSSVIQTTTLNADEIDALLGLSVVTYSTK
ncbi:hypothetical protein COEREDRAFT_79777 [Coemansia reversa NRRL 1564]|uniref:Uncharacterized protein n=1 Tax=Coemansia reversa (strain ATCC 12441 / NRRL 1564) TaxID=763665 RepID=A0A2G5BGW6_COERN|nr:hypothetical protein COEREDRAFT_79777 [Coemansia reversa NRRL 1564]|eukprot:PIA18264.1 hypothetical protein COEREDRAFT_79777 [Coemansia reversa NRRL 1564]